MVTDDSLWDTLGKSRKQEDEYCIIANKNPDNFVTDITVQEKATSKMIQQKYSDKRFIWLQATDDPSSGEWVDEEVTNAKPPSTPSASKKKWKRSTKSLSPFDMNKQQIGIVFKRLKE